VEEPKKAKPGWYPHPSMIDTRRYWDGEGWTTHIAPAEATHTVQVIEAGRQKHDDNLVIAGVVMCFVLPLGAFIAGCILLARRALVGTVMMLFAVLSSFVWVFVTTQLITGDDALDCAVENLDRAEEGLPLLDCPD